MTRNLVTIDTLQLLNKQFVEQTEKKWSNKTTDLQTYKYHRNGEIGRIGKNIPTRTIWKGVLDINYSEFNRAIQANIIILQSKLFLQTLHVKAKYTHKKVQPIPVALSRPLNISIFSHTTKT